MLKATSLEVNFLVADSLESNFLEAITLNQRRCKCRFWGSFLTCSNWNGNVQPATPRRQRVEGKRSTIPVGVVWYCKNRQWGRQLLCNTKRLRSYPTYQHGCCYSEFQSPKRSFRIQILKLVNFLEKHCGECDSLLTALHIGELDPNRLLKLSTLPSIRWKRLLIFFHISFFPLCRFPLVS